MEGIRSDILQAIETEVKSTSGHNMIWIRGSPGVGKSALTASISTQLQDQNRHVISFLFDRTQSTTITTDSLWRVVACDLARLYPSFRRHLVENFDYTSLFFLTMDSTPSEHRQPIPQKWSYVHLMSFEYSSVFLSGQGQQIIPNAVMSWLCAFWGCQIITHFTCETCVKAIAWGSPFSSKSMSLDLYIPTSLIWNRRRNKSSDYGTQPSSDNVSYLLAALLADGSDSILPCALWSPEVILGRE